MKWDAKLPRKAPEGNKAHFVFGFKNERGRMEFSGQINSDRAFEILKQLMKHSASDESQPEGGEK